MTTVDVSVVIPTYNMDFCLADCLQGLAGQTLTTGTFEIILVDDGSHDQTLATAQRLKEELGLANLKLAHQQNAGPAAARNHGIRLAEGAIIAFLDSDCVPQSGWLEHLSAPMRDHPALVGVEGRTLPAPGKRTLMDHYIDNPNGGYCWTCNIAFRRSLLLEIGGLDEGFPLPSGEDIDLAHRMRQRGDIAFAPEALVYHLILPRSFQKHLRVARTFSSMIRLHRKHPGLLTNGEGFGHVVLFQFKQLLLPIITRRREFPKAPLAYLQFCLLQVLMAVDTLLLLPQYYREATSPLRVLEPFSDPAGQAMQSEPRDVAS
ncbi:MAG TPA: glycosyltransferase [Coleofasciculaceae cyanobacterium]|jgi:glycosyltransferase involved in cell wall biosynthesis